MRPRETCKVNRIGDFGRYCGNWSTSVFTEHRVAMVLGQLGPVRDSSAPILRQLGPGVETARPNDNKWRLGPSLGRPSHHQREANFRLVDTSLLRQFCGKIYTKSGSRAQEDVLA
ncbi:hypothetical protein LSAT2_017520 [Lamellibrachia satsuma]|nr:hypothetical protein LSAT2_017520 [Lamellibrachia satsuma]